jgi:hypothetical protein
VDKLGKYQLIEKIGIGGFGEVYKGYDPLIKRHVAIKTCTSHSDDIRGRFFQEAEIAGNLHHRNITTVYDFGVQADLPYLVQEYLSGEDLDRKIKRKDDLPTAAKVALLVQIARGLAFAHANGVIHRDVKPANIRVLEDGTAKIMDFGIAKLALQESGLTQTGMTIGTAAYLSPEQVRGDTLDVRTDIFSFGVLAYELLAYQRPFEGRDISAVLYHVLHNEPRSLPELSPSSPPGLVHIVYRCLSKSAAGRFADGSELAHELERLQAQLATRIGTDNNLTMPIDAREAHLETTIRTPIERLPGGKGVAGPSGLGGLPLNPPSAPAGTGGYGQAGGPAVGPPRRPDLPLRRQVPSATEPSAVDPSLRMRRERIPGVGELELATGARPAPGGAFSASHTQQTRLPLPLPWIIVIGLLAFSALLIGILLGRGSARPPDLTSLSSGQAQHSLAAPAKASAPPAAPATTPSTAASSSTSPAKPPATPPAGTTAAATQKPPPNVPAPAAPVNGVVVLSKPAWTSAMTVTLGRRAYRLDQPRRLTLEAGTYNLTYQIDEDGYRASATTRVTVTADRDVTLAPAIAQPGVLTVRALPRRPQGDVLVGGQSQGGSPLTRRLAPGEHQLEIRGKDGTLAPLQRTIRIEPGKETIVSFDLQQSAAQIVVK